jgi:hypothetical protein
MSNVRLAGRIWNPQAAGRRHGDRFHAGTKRGGLTAVGLMTSVVAGALAWGYLRISKPAAVRVLRPAHSGSANDCAAYAVTGTLAVIAVLSLAR